MISVAHALLRRFRRSLIADSVAVAVRPRVRMRVEEIEPRILFSSDLTPAVLDQPGTQVQMRVVEPPPAAPAAQTEQAVSRELIVVDTATPDYQKLVDDIVAKNDPTRSFEVRLINGDADGIAEVTEILAGAGEFDTVHVISHGIAGGIRLGSSVLNIDTLQARSEEIATWGGALTQDGDMLIYGCDVAGSGDGRLLIDALAKLTGADVAASDDTTGSASLGGDWQLEYNQGAIEASALAQGAQQTWVGLLANAAPVLSGANSVTTILEDAAANNGTLVSDLIAGMTTDADIGAVGGIAVTAVNDTNGQWQYTTNAGGNWTGFGSASTSSARLLAADANTSVRFVPNADWNGTIASGITFRAWDQTTGVAGGTADTTNLASTVRDNFTTVSYSNNDGSANWSAGWVDSDGNPAAGSIDISGGTLQLDASGNATISRVADLSNATSASLSFAYTNSIPLTGGTARLQIFNTGTASYDTLATFSSGSNTGSGTLNFDIAAYISGATEIRFTVSSGLLGGTVTIDNVQIAYVTPLNGGSTAFSTATASSGITVTAVNDAPAGANATVATNEDASYALTTANFGFSDIDGNTLSAVTITTLPGAGTMTLSGLAVSAGQSISVANINAGNLVFTPAANANGVGYTSFTFQVQDNGGTANGGADIDATPNTLTFNVNAVNDAPAGTNNTVTMLEDATFTFTAAHFGFSDAVEGNALAAVKIAATPTAGTLTLSGVAVSAGQSIALASINAGNLVFTPAANGNGSGYASFTFQVQDNGGIANGGVDTDATPNTMTVDVTAVNDAPAGTNATVTTNEDIAITFTAASFGFTDAADANALTAVTITTVPGVGALTLSGTAVLAGDTISVANINAGNLVFTPAANANGAGYASFTFQVHDGGGTANGGTDIDATPNTLTINVNAVNDAPSGTNNAITITEDTSFTFGTAHFGFSDSVEGNALAGVKITTIPTGGALMLSGVAVIAGQTISAANIAAGNLVYTPAANGAGAGYGTFAFAVQDSGGVANGGVDTDQTPNTMTIDVTGVQDAPVLTGANNMTSILEDASGNAGTLVSDLIASVGTDPDAGAVLGIAVTAVNNTNGTWQYSTNGGSAWTSFGSPSAGTARLLAADANTSVRFVPNANFNGTVTNGITFRAWDQTSGTNGGVAPTIASPVLLDDFSSGGYTGNSGTATWTTNWVDDDGDSAAGRIKVTSAALELRTNSSGIAVYRQADLTGATSAMLSFAYNNQLNTGGASTIIAEVSNDGASFTTVATFSEALNVGTGTISTDISAFISSQTQVRFSIITANSPPRSLFVDNVQIAFTAAGNGGANAFSTATASSNITVTPVNDAPSGTNATVTTNEDVGYAFTAANFGFADTTDTGANSLAAVTITTLPAAGALTLSGAAVTLGQSVTVASINAGNLVFTPALNASGVGHASFTFQVQDDGGTANGGVDLDATPNTLAINVNASNDAPSGTNNTVTMLEDNVFTFTTANFGFSDAVEGNSFTAVTIAATPTAGALTLSGVAVSAGQSISVANITAGNLVYTPAANGNGSGYSSFTFRVQDDGGTANGGVDTDATPNTITLDVTAVNDEPAGTSATVTTNEDTALTFTAANFGFTDAVDGNALAAVRITTVPSVGTLTLSGVAVIAGDTISVASINGGNLVFTPVANANGASYASFTFQVQDSGGTANGGVDLDQTPNTLTVNVNSVNDAPSGTNATVVTNEDTGYTFTAASFGFTDSIDGNSLTGVRITGTPGAGTLALSGVAVTAGQTISLASINAGNLVFTPAANANGAGYTTFAFEVQDSGGTANGGVNTDPTPNTMTIDVTSVNDAPAGTNTTVTTNEDTAYAFTAANFGFTDVDGNAFAAVTITTLPAAGSLTLSGVAVTAGQSITVANINSGNLVFTSTANASGTGYASFTFQVQDNGGTANGGVALDATPNTMTVNVTSVNDAPAGTNTTVTTNEDTAYTFTTANFGFSDANDSPANTLSGVKITTIPGAGSLTLSGVAVSVGQTVSAANITAGNLKFTPAANANGAGYASFTFQVQDSGGIANGGVDLDASPNTMTVNVTSVNDAPSGTDTTVTTNEDTAYTFTTANFGFTDTSDSPANTLSSVRITTIPGAGTLTLSGSAVSANQSITVANITAGNLVFTPATNANGAGYASFTFQVQDGGGTANGGVALDPTPNTMTVNVTSVNDAPRGTNTTVTTNEDTAFTFTAATFGFTDPNDSPANTFTAVRVSTLPAAGTLTLSGVAVSVNQTVTIANINAGNLKFTPAANANGTGYASFTFRVQDSGGTANGGVDLDASANTITVNVTSVNDAPTGTNNTVTTNEDTALIFTTANFGFADTIDSNSLSAVKISSLPAAGTLTLSGVAVTTNQFISAANITAGNLRFTPAANAHANGYAAFTFQVQDTGGTSNGGVDVDVTPRTMTINVTSVNDAPTGSNNTVTVLEDTSYVFNTAVFGFSDSSDSPADSLAAVKITALPTGGTLTVSGAAVTAGQFVSAANIAAGNLVYTPGINGNGLGYGTFTFQVQDDGGTANGGIAVDTVARTMTINVTAVNDAPAGANTTVATNEDAAFTFTAANFGFTDLADSPANALAAVEITTVPATGTLTLSGVAVVNGQSISVANITAGNLVFTPAANANGAAYASFTFRVQDSGGIANGGVDIDPVARTMTIDVNAVNDAPTGTNNTLTVIEDTSFTFTTADFGFFDSVEANAFAAVKLTTLPAGGMLTLSGAAVATGQLISVADITAGNLVYTPGINGNGVGYGTFTFQVQDAGGTANGGADLDVIARTMNINVSAAGDSPLLTGANNLNPTLEDAAANSGTLVSDLIAGRVTDPDAGSLFGIAVTGVNNTNGVWQYSTNGGGAWSNFGSPTQGTARLLAGDANTFVRFVPDANWSGTLAGGLTFRAWDQTLGANGGVAPTISNPVLRDNFSTVSYSNNDGTATWTTDWVDTDALPGAGAISINGGVLDINTSSAGVAIFREADLTGALGATLSFSYDNQLAAASTILIEASNDGGGSFTTIGTFSSALNTGTGIFSADLAAYISNETQIRFTVSAVGGPVRSLQVDNLQVAFTAEGNGGSSAFSTGSASSSITVVAVNDAPSGANATVTTNEDIGYTFTAASFGFTDPTDVGANSLAAIRIATLPTAGALTLSGVAVTNGQFVSIASINAGNLVFTPAAEASGIGYASFTFQVQDDGGTANGGIDLDPVAYTMTVDVNAVNDAPTGAANTVTANEDAPFTFTAAHFGFSDTSDTPANALTAVRITSLPTAGTLTLSGSVTTAGQFVSIADINAGNLVFTPAPNGSGAGYSAFTFQVQDTGGTANGGVDLDATARTMTIDVTAVNDAPVGTSTTVTATEDTPFVFTAAAFGFTDPSDGPANALAAVTITTLPASGSLTLNGVAVVAGQSITAADIAAGQLVFTAALDVSGAAYTSFTFQVQDDGGTVGGGVDLDSIARTLTIDVAAVNDAPSGTDKTIVTLEDTALTFAAADFGFTDAIDSNAFAGVTISSIPTAGTLMLGGSAIGAGQFVSAAQLLAGSLQFVPAANASGAGYSTFTFQVQDDGGTAGGGVNLDPVARTMTVDVTAVNDAPVGTNTTVATPEETALVFNATMFGFTDPSDTGANALAAVRITTVPVTGTLTLSGVVVTAGQIVSAADLTAGDLIYTPAVDGTGAAYATFTFQVQDDGGTANAGADFDTIARTLTIDVTPVNDAPVGTNASVVAIEDTPFVFTTAAFTLADVSDTPANNLAAVTITTLPATGTLTLNGVAVIAGQSVSAAAIGAGQLVFTPGANGSGAGYSSFTFQVQDDGGTVNGGVDLDPIARTMTIDVTAVNDAPVGTSNTVVTLEDTAYVFSAATFGLTDLSDAPANNLAGVMISTVPVSGTLSLSGVAVTAGQVISVADLNAGNLAFTPGLNASGAGYASFTFRVQDDAGTANGGADLDTIARTLSINVTAQNDAPVGTSTTVTVLEDNALTFVLANFGFTDPSDTPANNFTGVRIASLPVGGVLRMNGVAVNSGDFVTAANIAAGRLVYTPPADAAGAGYANFTFQVRDDGGGADLDTTARTMTIDVTGVNDAPSGSDGVVTANEDVTFAFTAAAFGLTDPIDAPGNALASVRITAIPATGALRLAGVAVMAGQTVTVADINAGLLTFNAATNASGVGYASLNFRVQDDGGTANGGVDLDATANTLTINVTPVNDPPTGANNTVTTAEDTAFTFTTAMFGFSDPDDSPADGLFAITIASLPTSGTLMLNGVAVTASQSIAVANIAAGQLAYTPGANGTGAAYTSFSFVVQDSGGTANGGLDSDAAARTMTVNVTPVNDAPTAADSTIATVVNTAYVFTPGSFGFSDSADVPGNNFIAVHVTGVPAAGALSLNGVLVAAGQVITMADIIGGDFAYVPPANIIMNGAATFTFRVQDDGGGADIALIARTITIDIVPPPAGTVAPSAPPPVIVPAPPPTAQTPANALTTAVLAPAPVTQQASDSRSSTSAQPLPAVAFKDLDASLASANDPTRGAVVQLALQRLDTQPHQEARTTGTEAQALAVVAERITDSSAASASAQSRASQVAAPAADNRELFTQVNQIRADLREEQKFEAHAMAATAATGVSLSVGFVIWLLRGGALVSTLLSSVPAWRFVDPLPVLGNTTGADGDFEDDSLESLVSADADDDLIPQGDGSKPETTLA